MGQYLSFNGAGEVYDVRKIYWDADGNLRYGTSTRQRDDEIIQILQADSNDDSDEDKMWMIIPSRWIRLWLQFAYLKIGNPPGEIDMKSLLVRDPAAPDGWRPKTNLLPPVLKGVGGTEEEEHPGHFRRIGLPAWLKLVELYGSNAGALAVRGNPPNDVSRWGYFSNPKVIDINKLQPGKKKVKVEEKKKKGGVGGFLSSILGGDKKDKDVVDEEKPLNKDVSIPEGGSGDNKK
jgi:hypothetical protein